MQFNRFLRLPGVFLLFALSFTAKGGNPSLEIEIRGVKALPGEVLVAVYAGEAGFPSRSQLAIRTGKAKRSGSSATIRFDDLKPGTYAVSVIHDANNNQLLDTGFLGVPKEGYGISKNAINRFGPPEYAECSFSLTRSEKILIDLKY